MPRKRAAPSATTIVFVRHGQTPTTGRLLPGRAAGLHLADEGRAQAAAAAERLTPLAGKVAAIYASPLERTRETAAPIATTLGLRIRTDKRLLDCDTGAWTGEELKDLRKRPEWKTVQRYPSGFRFPAGESFLEMQARLNSFVTDITSRHAHTTVVAVSHADPIRVVVAGAMGAPLDLFQRVLISPCSISVIAYSAEGPYVVCANSTGGHLDGVGG